jgi:hypothetical protein
MIWRAISVRPDEGAEGRPRYGLLGIFLSVQLEVAAAAVAQESAVTAVTAVRRTRAAYSGGGGEGQTCERVNGSGGGRVGGVADWVGSGRLGPLFSVYFLTFMSPKALHMVSLTWPVTSSKAFRTLVP